MLTNDTKIDDRVDASGPLEIYATAVLAGIAFLNRINLRQSKVNKLSPYAQSPHTETADLSPEKLRASELTGE